MKNQFWTTIMAVLAFGGIQYLTATTLRIPYTGGKQSGIVKIKGDNYGMPDTAGYLDTVIVDENLLITNYLASKSFSNAHSCAFLPTHQFGLFVAGQTNGLGRLDALDTNWSAAKTFPDNLSSLDTVPISGYALNKDLGTSAKGINVDTLFTDGECIPNQIHLINGYSRIVYFSYSNGSGMRYGKLTIYGYGLSSNLLGRSMSYLNIAYTISNTKDLDSGPVGILTPSKNFKINFDSGKLFDPLGRSQKASDSHREFFPIPLLSPAR